MHHKKSFLSIRKWLFISAAVLVFFLMGASSIRIFLSPTKRLKDTSVLVIEGWIPDYALKEAVQEFNTHNYQRLITTGGPLVTDYRAFIGGKLHFSIPDSLHKRVSGHPLLVQAQGSYVSGESAHFTLWVNDTVYIGETFTSNRMTTYRFPMDSCITEVKTVHIHFDNDKMTRTQDRDLFLRNITVGRTSIRYNSGIMLYEQHWPDEVKNIRILPTYAENAAADLIRLGIDSSKISVVTSLPVHTHKTFHAASALKTYLLQQQVSSFNLLSVGVHTRRSWLTYQKALGNTFSIGIISVENKTYDPDYWWLKKNITKGVLREAAKYLYIRFWFSPPAQA